VFQVRGKLNEGLRESSIRVQGELTGRETKKGGIVPRKVLRVRRRETEEPTRWKMSDRKVCRELEWLKSKVQRKKS
jgi:hypothetical protein